MTRYVDFKASFIALLLVVVHLEQFVLHKRAFGVEGKMEDRFEKCCNLGTSWAKEGLKCEKFTGPVAGVPRVEQGLCLETVDICCNRAYHELQCEKGKADARQGLACVTSSKSKAPGRGDYHRDCCEGCKLGILTGSLGKGCSFKSFSFGIPWDPAFLECCREASPSSTTDLTSELSSESTETDMDSSSPSSPSSSPYSSSPSSSSSSTTSFSPSSSSSSSSSLSPTSFSPSSSSSSSLSTSFSPSSPTSSSSTSDSSSTSPESTTYSIPTPELDDICQLMKGMLCSDICVPTPGSYYCKCRDGFTLLEDGKTCRQDPPTDRCKPTHPCEHRCTDTGVAVVCSCNPGYELADDARSCILKSSKKERPKTNDDEDLPLCPSGYRYNSTNQVCDDIDECAEGLDNCGDDEICYNQPGGYSCARAPVPITRRPTTTAMPVPSNQKCIRGTRFVRNRGCVDINECRELEDACSSNEECINTLGSYTCTCKTGFRRDNLTQACVDINECQLQQNDCLPTQRCDNTIGSYSCTRFLSCGTGYTLNAATEICEDDDECVLGTHDCGSEYQCRNTLGSYRCDRIPRLSAPQPRTSPITMRATTTTTSLTPTGPWTNCTAGFEPGSGGKCMDIDECQIIPSPCSRFMQKCINTMGSYRCVSGIICRPGYTLDPTGQYCIDIDECQEGTHKCGKGQTCENRQGGYHCICPAGFAVGLNNDCIDIDECSLHTGSPYSVCGPNSRCENTVGSYKCLCGEGFENIGGAGSCYDIDECQQTGLCQHECLNTWGSYICTCNPGFRLNKYDNRSCIDIDECTEFKDNNLCMGICENTPGSYTCKCPDGYRLGIDGRTCQDIDECSTGHVCRGADETCQNTRGSYRCNQINCPPEFYRDSMRKNRCTKQYCHVNDLACLRLPSHYSYHFITFVSMLPIPSTGQIELFTMRGTHQSDSTIQFSMALVDVRAPPGVGRATESCFALRRPSPSQAVLVLTRSIAGPQDIELDLSMEIYHGNLFAGSAVAKILIFVSQYEF